jgi:hypothetical protein
MSDIGPRKTFVATPANAAAFERLAVLAVDGVADVVADLQAQGVWDGWEGAFLSIERPLYDELLREHGRGARAGAPDATASTATDTDTNQVSVSPATKQQ